MDSGFNKRNQVVALATAKVLTTRAVPRLKEASFEAPELQELQVSSI